MPTSKKDASQASKLLSNPKTPKNVKSVAGSDLAQAKPRRRRGGSSPGTPQRVTRGQVAGRRPLTVDAGAGAACPSAPARFARRW